MTKPTLYFLDWLEENYNIDIDLWLENCKEENKGWLDLRELDASIDPKSFTNCFDWDCALDQNPSYGLIDDEWIDIIREKKYNIEYSRFPIKDFKILIPTGDFKLNFN